MYVDHLPVAYAATLAVLAILTKDDLGDLLRSQWKRAQRWWATKKIQRRHR